MSGSSDIHGTSDAKPSARGKLKIFFGGCAGVGKTFAMLSAGHERRQEQIDVVAGFVETHGREEARKMLADMPVIPPLEIPYQGAVLREFDLDAAKTRKPAILLIDELAHTNAPGARHPKRWNDVEELLEAGISVYTTLNVQHLESLNDVVANVSGVQVKETIPDSVFDSADDIILVDINADELLKRMQEGKVCLDDPAKAAGSFFKKSNLISLRELALRRTTERVDAQMEAYNQREGIKDAAPVADKVMVCIGPDPLSAKLVRTAKRMAASLKAPFTTAYVENARHYRLNDRGKALVDSFMRMGERMGGKSVVLQGNNAADEIVAYAHAHGITKIIVGKQNKPRWKDMVFGTLVDAILRRSDNIDLYVVTGENTTRKPITGKSDLFQFRPKLYGWAIIAVAAATIINLGLTPLLILTAIDQVMIYLIGVVMVATRFGRGPSLLCSLLSVTAFNFFFVHPNLSLNVSDRSYWMTFLVMMFTSIVISSQSSQLRLQAFFSRQRERDTQTLYTLAREMASTRGRQNISEVTARHVREVFDTDVTIWLPDAEGRLAAVVGALPERDIIRETGVLHWCFNHSHIAGRDTSTMPSAIGLYLPLISSGSALGVLGILPKNTERHFSLEEMSSLETFASLLASALGRTQS